MTNNYSIPDFPHLNDRLIYIDHVQRRYNYQEASVLPADAYRYQGNLYGLFRQLRISPALYTYAMYLNGYSHPANYEGVKNTFKLPVKPPIPDY